MRTKSWLGLGIGGVVATALGVSLVMLDPMQHESPRPVSAAKPATSGESGESAAAERPAAPTGFRGRVGDTFATVRWNSVIGATSYAVYYRDVTKGERLKLLEQAQRTTITLAGLTNGDTYEFQLSARNAAGEGPRAPAVVVRVMPPKPARPRQLRAHALMNQVWLTWIEPRGPMVSFWVEMRDVGAGTPSKRHAPFKRQPTATGTNRYLVTDLLRGHTYQFRVVAENAAGRSTSATVSATPS